MPFVTITGLKIHFEEAGSGNETLLLIHGNFSSWRWWKMVMEQLPPDCHAYAPDLRGCGETDHTPEGHTIEQLADDLYELTKALRLNKLHIIGHSLGGAVAMQFTLDHPNIVTDLLLIGPAPAEGMSLIHKRTEQSWLFDILQLFSPQNMLPKLTRDTIGSAYKSVQNLPSTRQLFRQAVAKMTPTWKHEDNPAFDALVDDAISMSPQAMTGHLSSLKKWNIQSQLSQIKIPVLVLLGKMDNLVHRDKVERTVDGLKNGTIVVWDDVGHSPQIEQTERFIKLMSRFIEQNKSKKLIPRKLRSLWQKLLKLLK